MRRLLEQTRLLSGRVFLDQLTTGLSELLGGAYVQVGRLSSDARSIAADPCARHGKLLPPIQYDLQDTPCAHVVGLQTRYFAHGIAEQFPADVFLKENGFVSYLGCPMFSSQSKPSGLLSVLATQPLSFDQNEIAFFEALALRAGADMERGEAVAARAASEALVREIVDQQMEMVCRFTPEGRLTFANRAYMETFGVTPEHLESFAFEPRIHPDDVALVREAVARITPDNQRVVIENRILAVDGQTLWTQWTNVGLHDEHGRLLGYQSAGRDITAAKLAEERLHQAHEQKDRFLAILAHELRNPLGAVMNALAILELNAAQGRIDPRPLAVAKRQAQQQARLLDDLLDLSRITRGKLQLRKSSLPLWRVVAEVAEARRSVFAAKEQSLQVLLPAEDVFVDADRVRLEQIISNLLDNASKYTPARGQVRVEGEIVDGDARIRVEDSGQGISKEMLPRVFEMFEQDPRSGDASGLGIGLTVVREMVKRHGGEVFADSAGPGKGSTFTVVLPTIAMPDSLAPTPAIDRPAGRRHVLVVDDNQDAADTLAELLQGWGHEVAVAYSGESAIALARTWRPDVAFIDIGMPGLDGYATARKLRAEHPDASSVLVALTGFGQTSDIASARAASFDRHLTKPADPVALQTILRDGG